MVLISRKEGFNMAWKLVSSRRHTAEATQKKKNRKKTWRFLTILFVILALVIGVEAYIYFYLFGNLQHDNEFTVLSAEELAQISMDESVQTDLSRTAQTLTEPEEEAPEGELLYSVIPDDILEQYYAGSGKILNRRLKPEAKNIELFVLYGVDDYEGDIEHATTDAIMLVALDKVHHKLKFISLSRDSYVFDPERGAMIKLNYAYFYDGVKGAVSTLNANFYLDISDYVVVRMSEFSKLVDMVGGVTVELTQEEIDRNSLLSGFTPGMQLLNGKQATAYARMRKIDNDTYRSNRQFNVISSFISTAKQTSPTKYPAIVREALGLCATSFSSTEILSMSSILLDSELSISHCYLPDSDKAWSGEIDGHFYYVYDTLEASDEICKTVYEDLYESEFVTAE